MIKIEAFKTADGTVFDNEPDAVVHEVFTGIRHDYCRAPIVIEATEAVSIEEYVFWITENPDLARRILESAQIIKKLLDNQR